MIHLYETSFLKHLESIYYFKRVHCDLGDPDQRAPGGFDSYRDYQNDDFDDSGSVGTSTYLQLYKYNFQDRTESTVPGYEIHACPEI